MTRGEDSVNGMEVLKRGRAQRESRVGMILLLPAAKTAFEKTHFGCFAAG
jgi:hypothetical protein